MPDLHALDMESCPQMDYFTRADPPESEHPSGPSKQELSATHVAPWHPFGAC